MRNIIRRGVNQHTVCNYTAEIYGYLASIHAAACIYAFCGHTYCDSDV